MHLELEQRTLYDKGLLASTMKDQNMDKVKYWPCSCNREMKEEDANVLGMQNYCRKEIHFPRFYYQSSLSFIDFSRSVLCVLRDQPNHLGLKE